MAKMDDSTKLLAIGLLNFCDDEGYFYAQDNLVRSALRPFDDDSKIVRASLLNLAKIGYLEIKESPTHGQIGRVVNFTSHQRVDKPKESTIKCLYNSSNDLGSILDQSRLEGKGREQGKERNGASNEALSFCGWFETLIPEGMRPKSESIRKEWAAVYDDLLRIDKQTKDSVHKVCKWAREDEFWKKNFLSPLKLRKKNGDGISYFQVFLNQMSSNGVPQSSHRVLTKDNND